MTMRRCRIILALVIVGSVATMIEAMGEAPTPEMDDELTFVGEGESCQETVTPAFATYCLPGLECTPSNPGLLGSPGICTPVQAPAPETDDELASSFFIGSVNVLPEAMPFTDISRIVCASVAEVNSLNTNWTEVRTMYTAVYEIDGYEYSLKALGEEGISVFGEPQGRYWEQYGTYFGDDSWIHSQIMSVIENGTASGVNTKELAVQINGALIDALQLGAAIAFLEDARENLVLGLENPQLMIDDVKYSALEDWDIGWALLHGADDISHPKGSTPSDGIYNGCAPYGTLESTSASFGKYDDSVGTVRDYIEFGRETIMAIDAYEELEEAISDIEFLLVSIVEEFVVTHLRQVALAAADYNSTSKPSPAYLEKFRSSVRVIVPIIDAVSPNTATVLNTQLESIDADAVSDAITAILPDLQVDLEDFGNINMKIVP